MFYPLNYMWLQKVKYLLNGNSDLYEILTLAHNIVFDHQKKFRENPCALAINKRTHDEMRTLVIKCVHTQ